MPVTEHKLLDRFAKFWRSGHRQITFAGFVLEDLLFCLFDAVQNRRVSIGILVDANRQINFLGTGIFFERFGQSQDGIRFGRLEFFEHLQSASKKTSR